MVLSTLSYIVSFSRQKSGVYYETLLCSIDGFVDKEWWITPPECNLPNLLYCGDQYAIVSPDWNLTKSFVVWRDAELTCNVDGKEMNMVGYVLYYHNVGETVAVEAALAYRDGVLVDYRIIEPLSAS